MIISMLLEKLPAFDYKKSAVTFLILLSLVYCYVGNSFSTALILVFPAVIALLFGSPLAAALLLLRIYISSPFNLITMISNSALKFTSVFYWLYLVAAIYLIYLIVVYIIKALRTKEEL